MTDGWITKTELLEPVGAAGFDAPTGPQLDRLTRAGLLQRPRQHHPPGQRGSQTLYPGQAAAQLVGVLRLRREVRPFDRLRFWAWWDGLWVEPRALHNTLISWVAAAVRGFEKEVRPHDEPLDAIDAIHQKYELARRRGPQWLRHRVGTRPVPDAIDLLLLLAAGGQPDWNPVQPSRRDRQMKPEPTPGELLAKAFGLDKLAEPLRPGSPIAGPLVPDPPTAEQLTTTLQESGMTSPGNWLRAVRSASIPELGQARPVARAIVDDLPVIAEALSRYTADPADPWGLGPFQVTGRRDRQALEHAALNVAQAVLLRRSLPAKKLSDVVDAVAVAAAEIREVISLQQANP